MATWFGFLFAGFSVLAFGSSYIPVKAFDTGDGMFFQWVMGASIFMVGLVVNLIRYGMTYPTVEPFQPLAMLGGFLWATGNITVVPIMGMIGIGLGMLTWGLCNMIVGWAVPNFGLFGLAAQAPQGTLAMVLNYGGVLTAILAMIPYAMLESSGGEAQQETAEETQSILLRPDDVLNSSKALHVKEPSFIDSLSPLQRRFGGFFLSILAGFFYGTNFDPPQWLIDHNRGSKQGIDYVFSHFTGIFATATLYFLIYCVYKRNKPYINFQLILPSFACGLLWASAQVSWFIANSYLPLATTFPIIGTGPGAVSALWGVIVYKEIRGKRNFLYLAVAFALTIAGIIQISMSKHFDTAVHNATLAPTPPPATNCTCAPTLRF
jgi:glucose uptake protein GlcU